MLGYNYFKEIIVPPVFIIGFTLAVPILALFGKGESISILKIVHYAAPANLFAWQFVSVFILWAIIWLLLTNKETKGDRAPNGYIPTFKDNGVSYYLISVFTFLCIQYIWPKVSNLIFENTPDILGTLNIVAFALCIFLYNRSQEGSDLPKLFLFYRGRELHPNICKIQIKQLVIFRIGIMLWQIQVLAYYFVALEKRSFDVPTAVTCLLQTIYLCKTFIYEPAYYHTLDINMDRDGYYLMWGSLVFMPCLFPFNSYYLVNLKPIASDLNSILALLLGITCFSITLIIDFQKARFRQTNGKTLIWNKPPTFIKARYTDGTGTERTSLLLTSGFWGLARHLNYTFELISNLSWALPGHGLGIPVYFLTILLASLIFHRLFRDETKCKAKYGKYWEQYCKKVPYRFIPYVF